jgi:hypothetical protein
MTIQEAVNQFKENYEASIRLGGEVSKTSDIRSQKLINLIHEAVKSELVNNGVKRNQIFPTLQETEEITLTGFLKKKKQDIIVVPQNLVPNKQSLSRKQIKQFFSSLEANRLEKILSINVRSQLSSLAKNFDTLYERTFAEAMNLHLHCSNMCLGEVYMIPVYEYDTKAAQYNEVRFSARVGVLEKYLFAFNAIAERNSTESDHYKYEKVCLLIVDFSRDMPKIYSSDEELKGDGLISSDSMASIRNLTFTQFVPSLLEIYQRRFGQMP